jgi:hypothetical protein
MSSDIQSVARLNDKVDSVAHPDQETSHIAVFGNQAVREQVVASASHSATSTSFSYQSPGETSLIDRTIMLRMKVKVRLTSADTFTPSAVNSAVCPSAFPLSRAMQNLNLQLNNQSISLEPSKYFPAMSRFFQNDELREMNSFTPTMPDSYNVNGLQQPTADNAHVFNVGDSPLRLEGYVTGKEDTRGAFPRTVTVVQAGGVDIPGIVDITYEFCEPLPHSLLSRFGDGALTRVSNINVNISWLNALSMFQIGTLRNTAGDEAPVVTSVTFDPTAELLVRTYSASVDIPPSVTLPFQQLNVKSFTGSTVAINDTGTVNTGQIVYNMVPSRILVFGRRRADVQNATTPDGYMSIKSCVLRSEQNVELSGASQQQLYQMSKKNGYNDSWRRWSKRSGSLMMIDVSHDLGSYVSGARERFSFDMTVNFQNTFYTTLTDEAVEAVPFDMYIVAYFDSTITLNGTSAYISEGIHSGEIMSALSKGFAGADRIPRLVTNGAHGSGIGSFVRHAFKNVVKPLANATGHLLQTMPGPKAKISGSLLSSLTGGSVQKLSG